MNLYNALSTEFWRNHAIGDKYELTNRNGSKETCKIAYYPLGDYSDFTALIEIARLGFNDFREVPIRFLTKLKAV